MKKRVTVLVLLLSLGAPLFAHRLDEYLQAIIVSVEPTRIQVSMRLIPGVAVSSAVISAADSNGDGRFSSSEQQLYAQRVLRDLSLSEDGHTLTPRLESVSFPALADMKQGLGEIRIGFTAELPPGGPQRALVIDNHHQPDISVYLVNCLAPLDPGINVVSQSRNSNQSHYRVTYMQSGGSTEPFFVSWQGRLDSILSAFAGVPSMFRLGMRHIAQGTDHLLFLLALLIPAPLVGGRSRWLVSGGVRHSLLQILRVVTAFTVGHSITLALGAWGVISLPSRPVEVLIAVSILVSALHALRPLFPGREPLIAAGFGLIHGMAFAATLQNLGVGAWQRAASILGFNTGIETMQLMVVSAILPSLILLSRTPAYQWFRVFGASFAALASLGWIVERLFGLNCSVDLVTDSLAEHATAIAILLAITSIGSWLIHNARMNRACDAGQLSNMGSQVLRTLTSIDRSQRHHADVV